MLLILQRRGRVRSGQLAEELEVSVRTILRDVEALSMAGVPVRSVRGGGGGIELLGGFRTDLTGLTVEEASAWFLAGQPRLAHRLGLSAPARSARRKSVESLSTEVRGRPDSLDRWFLHDPDPWDGHHIPHGELRRLASAIERQVVVELTLASRTDIVRTAPLGIVHKAGQWILVGQVEAGVDEPGVVTVVDLTDLLGTRITRTQIAAPSDFELASFWQAFRDDGRATTTAQLGR